jgi:spermidine synthase
MAMNYFLPVVFLTGAAILVIEVVAVRILSPYFGNTIFNFSSVLSTILLALSVGYYLGGIRADKNPSEKHFFGLISLSGLLVLAFHALSLFVLPFLAYTFSTVEGPLISAFFLFSVPAVLLGMLSPYAIKLQALKFAERGIGNISGTTFFWSTFGSITGSVGTGFFLIPHFGVNTIMWATGLFLLFLGTLGLVMLPGGKVPAVTRFLAGVGLFTLMQLIPSFEPEVVYAKDGVYERIIVAEEQIDGRPAIVLHQDLSSSGAIFRDSSDAALPFLEFYKLASLVPGGPKRALVLGGGAFLVPKLLLEHYPDVIVDVVEIEPELHRVAHRSFGLPESDRLRVHITDGRRFLYDSEGNYDLIFGDTYHSLYSVPAHFTSVEFFKLVQEKLSPHGLFFANMIGSLSRAQPSLTLSELRTFKEVFKDAHLFALYPKRFYEPQNLMYVGFAANPSLTWQERAAQTQDSTFLNYLDERRILAERFVLDDYTLLTDDYAPVDYMTAAMARRLVQRKKDPGAILRNEFEPLRQQLGENSERLRLELESVLSQFKENSHWLEGSLSGAESSPIAFIVAANPASRALGLFVLHSAGLFDSSKRKQLHFYFLTGNEAIQPEATENSVSISVGDTGAGLEEVQRQARELLNRVAITG